MDRQGGWEEGARGARERGVNKNVKMLLKSFLGGFKIAHEVCRKNVYAAGSSKPGLLKI